MPSPSYSRRVLSKTPTHILYLLFKSQLIFSPLDGPYVGVGTRGAQGARAPPPKFLPRPKSALFRDEKCALFAEFNIAVKTTIF